MENFALSYRSSKCVIDLARQSGRSEHDKVDCRQSAKLTIPACDDRLLVYQSDHRDMSTALFRPAGPLLTADTCRGMLAFGQLQIMTE